MRSPTSLAATRRRGRSSRVIALALGGALVLAACGGGSDSTTSADTQPVADVVDGAADGAAEANGDAAGAVADGPGLVDLVGPDVIGTAEIETNPLPSVVIDDVTNGRKVNFRNLVPQEKPILLWMYAPH